jgi:hypothetical protein
LQCTHTYSRGKAMTEAITNSPHKHTNTQTFSCARANAALHCTALHCTALHCTALRSLTHYNNVTHRTAQGGKHIRQHGLRQCGGSVRSEPIHQSSFALTGSGTFRYHDNHSRCCCCLCCSCCHGCVVVVRCRCVPSKFPGTAKPSGSLSIGLFC